MNQTTNTKQLSRSGKVKETISQAITALQDITDEPAIKAITTECWTTLEDLVPNKNSFRHTRKQFRDAIEQAFPCPQQPKPGYYLTRAGKEKDERYEHLALWYATTNKDRWTVMGNESRNQYFQEIDQKYNQDAETQASFEVEPVVESVVESVVEPIQQQTQWSLENMTIENLNLDSNTQEIVEDAIAQLKMSLPEFLQQACRAYANTVTAKSRKHSTDISSVETKTLRQDKFYSNHPGRAEELVKRAIQAIKYHNGQSTELNQKWLITQSLLVDMTGAKATSVKTAMSQYQTDIDSYNQTLYEAGATPLLNRKGELKEDFCDEWVRHSLTGID